MKQAMVSMVLKAALPAAAGALGAYAAASYADLFAAFCQGAG